MMRRFKSFICRSTWTFSPKIVMSFIFSVLLVSTIFYLKTVFFPDFTFLQVAHCVNVNDMALTTITPNPMETQMLLDNQIESSSLDSEEFLEEEERKAYKEALRKEKKMMCIGFTTYGIVSFALTVTLSTCYFLACMSKIC